MAIGDNVKKTMYTDTVSVKNYLYLSHIKDEYTKFDCDKSKIVDIWNNTHGISIGVVGDPILDIYHYCHAEGLSHDGPFVNWIEDERIIYPGGCLAVANHLKYFNAILNIEVPEGTDECVYYPRILKAMRESDESHPVYIVQVNDICGPTIKHRIMCGCDRMYRWTERKISTARTELTWMNNQNIKGLVCSSFGYGMLKNGFTDIAANVGENIQIFVDCQDSEMIPLWQFHNVFLFATEEEMSNCHFVNRSFAGVFVKHGIEGVRLPMLKNFEVPAFNLEPIDTMGSGDAFLAAASMVLSMDGSLQKEAAIIGSVAAGIKCAHVGNGAVNRQEINYVISL